MFTVSIIGSMKNETLMCVFAKKLQSSMKDCIVFTPDMNNTIVRKIKKDIRIDDVELSNIKAKHLKCIDLSDVVFCIEPIGKDTREELKYAKKHKKCIIYLSDIIHYFHDDELVMKAIKGV